MIPERVGIKIWDLRAEARDELYLLIESKQQLRGSDSKLIVMPHLSEGKNGLNGNVALFEVKYLSSA